MREKIVAVIFAIIIVAIPLVTIAKKTFFKEEPQITEEGSIAELNREEQLYMQQALEQNGMAEGAIYASAYWIHHLRDLPLPVFCRP